MQQEQWPAVPVWLAWPPPPLRPGALPAPPPAPPPGAALPLASATPSRRSAEAVATSLASPAVCSAACRRHTGLSCTGGSWRSCPGRGSAGGAAPPLLEPPCGRRQRGSTERVVLRSVAVLRSAAEQRGEGGSCRRGAGGGRHPTLSKDSRPSAGPSSPRLLPGCTGGMLSNASTFINSSLDMLAATCLAFLQSVLVYRGGEQAASKLDRLEARVGKGCGVLY